MLMLVKEAELVENHTQLQSKMKKSQKSTSIFDANSSEHSSSEVSDNPVEDPFAKNMRQ